MIMFHEMFAAVNHSCCLVEDMNTTHLKLNGRYEKLSEL